LSSLKPRLGFPTTICGSIHVDQESAALSKGGTGSAEERRGEERRIMNRTISCSVDRLERIARVMGVVVGMFVLSLTVIGPQSAWGLLGAVPVAMGWSGW
jgi:hypothetical protein